VLARRVIGRARQDRGEEHDRALIGRPCVACRLARAAVSNEIAGGSRHHPYVDNPAQL